MSEDVFNQIKCRVEWVNEQKHKSLSKLKSKKILWSRGHESYMLNQFKNKNGLIVVRIHKDTIVIGVFVNRNPRSYRRYIILKKWFADPYLAQHTEPSVEPGAFLYSIMNDLINRPSSIKDFANDSSITI